MAFKHYAFKAGLPIAAAISLGATSLMLPGCAKGPGTEIGSGAVVPSETTLTSGITKAAAAGTSGPVRMARVSYATGKVSWRPDGTTAWSPAVVNLPMRQGAEAWLAPGSRLELQFDDGSTMRLGDGAVATLQTLYSDNQGEFTEVKLNSGTASCHLKDKYSIYQVDMPYDSVKSVGPADVRMDVKAHADSCAVRNGSSTLSAGGRDTPILAGQYTVQQSPDDPVHVRSLGPEDPWDHFNDNRNALLSEQPAHVPENIALVSGGLDHHGHWHNVPGDGWVWSPTVEVGWRPYHHGRWAWVDPYGWTWVSSEPWGWAPYHYGTWAHFGFGWGWAPGPRVQYWSPARVDFAESNGYVTWAPLAPEEVAYPEFSVGFGGGNWWASFSIGGAGVYEPYGPGLCEPVPYAYGYGDPGWRRHGWQPGGWGQGNFAANPYNFVPRNAVYGAVGVSSRGFGGNVQFNAISRNASGSFRAGTQAVANRQAFSGPVNVRPNRSAFTPSHSFTSNARPAAMNRALVRGAVPANVARTGGSFGAVARANSRPNGIATRTRSVATGVTRAPSNVAAARQSMAFHGRNGATASAPRNARTTGVGTSNVRGAALRSNVSSGVKRTNAPQRTVSSSVRRTSNPRTNVSSGVKRANAPQRTVSSSVRRTSNPRTNVSSSVKRANAPQRTVSSSVRRTSNPRTNVSSSVKRSTTTRTNTRQTTQQPRARQTNTSRVRTQTTTRVPRSTGTRSQAPVRGGNGGGGRGAAPTKQGGGGRGAAPTKQTGGGKVPRNGGG